ncbi:MAG TPA: 5-dehydro-4-deoxy-D-glucuronate isomerase [Flavisolibacter sp.]|jgi:4-deoxy-L-threo-5-hexosulose-uronate ketol-isomerase|nr:5-dehydro-4-deoxy-D-glucuronate isomerase [Flavisolibacter sp.]
MKQVYAVHPDDYKSYNTEGIRKNFLLESLFEAGKINFVYTHYDRMIVGGAMPTNSEIELLNFPILKADYFLERRELGIINVGGDGTVNVDGEKFTLSKLDCLYVGKGVQKVSFASLNASQPAVLYILSAPAHAKYPTTLLQKKDSESNSLGSLETSNQRTIYRYIHKNGIQSCQLVMGLTILDKGSVWNTIPPHTHDRRMEAYFYFDVPENQVVFHYMGLPQETRHIVMKNYQAVVSPPWSIHAGGGTSNYGFIWGMAGENLEYSDMDGIQLNDLK